MIRVDPATLTTAPPPAASAGTSAPAPARALIERQLAMLTRLAEIGMEIAEAAGRQATGTPAGAPNAAGIGAKGAPMRDPGLLYTRAARAVRLTIALQSRLMADLAGLDRAEGLAEAERKSLRQARLCRLVTRAVEAGRDGGEDGGEDEIEQRSWEARERLAEAELDAELDGLPFVAVVAHICEDLGLSPELTARIAAAAGQDEGAGDSFGDGPRTASRPPAPQAGERPLEDRSSGRARPRAPPH